MVTFVARARVGGANLHSHACTKIGVRLLETNSDSVLQVKSTNAIF